MATKTASKATAKKGPAKKAGAKTGEICFRVGRNINPEKIQVFDLKKGGKDLTLEDLLKILKKASQSDVGFVVLNAPFKLHRTPESVPQLL